MTIKRNRRGFTLVEVMLAVTISVFVFAGMGVLLSRAFNLWMEGAARWKLAQYSRITRERILRGGFGVSQTNVPLEGLLVATNISIESVSSARNVAYATETNFYGICAYTNIVSPRLYLIDQNSMAPYWFGGYTDWRWGVENRKGGGIPEIEITHMDASHSNSVVELVYQLRYAAMGRQFTQPTTVRAYLINE